MRLKKFALFLLGVACSLAGNAQQYTQYVNPQIGSGGHGHVFVGANVPFGYVQLGPTQPTRGWDWCSGYHESDSVLIGFGHQHLSGTGIGELGDVAFLPVSCCRQKEVRFSHEAENVAPGYYSVKLKDPNVLVELTATQRAGFQRYTAGANVPHGKFRLDLKQGIGWDKMKRSGFRMVGDRAISGYRESNGWAKHQYVFFYAEFNKPVKLEKGQDSVAIFSYENDGTPLLIKTGLSAVSEDNAKANLEQEIPGWDFNAVVAQADNAWNEELGKVQVKTEDADARTVFYTALYHTMVAPSVFGDVNGQYRGSDLEVHQGTFTNYTTFSLWDTYRAAFPLMTILHTDKLRDMAETFLHIYKEQGKLPVWHLMGNETDCMVGNPGIPVLADLLIKGYVSDKRAALEAMKASALLDERGLASLKKNGYVAFDEDPTHETVAKTLEYALADASIAMAAKSMGAVKDYKFFWNRSQSYRKVFDKRVGFMRGKDSKGNWRTPFNPFNAVHRMDDYTEGNAWQYTWLVPHDVHGLVSCFGGEQPFVTKLDSLFIVTGDMGAEASPDISGLIGQYAHGNEPSHHVLYMYNYVGQPWKGQKLIRQTLNEMYSNTSDGLSGNEDVGQMSAWYVISAMGLYQVEPAGGKFVFGSPLFDEVTVGLPEGKTFTVKAINNSKDNVYVQSVRLNGKPYTKSYIMYSDIMNGGELEFTMGSQPSKFGTAKKDRP